MNKCVKVALTGSLLLTALACSKPPHQTSPEQQAGMQRLDQPAPPRIVVDGPVGGAARGSSSTPVFAAEQRNYFAPAESANYTPGSAAAPGRSRGFMAHNPLPPTHDDPTVIPSGDDYKVAIQEPLSTFSADVDTASYTYFRRTLDGGQLPIPELVRVEEMLNYFSYQLPEPAAGAPFSLTSELSDCPWNKNARLLRVAIATPSIKNEERPPCNLVFLIDVSGSMSSADKLPLLQASLVNLVNSLDEADRVAIVTYAGQSGVVLDSTPASDKATIIKAIEGLRAGGSTNGGSGLELAYEIARRHGSEDGVNRVILASDGDFNVGPSNVEELKKLIEQKRQSGVFLSVLGFGGRRYNDAIMETLADHGNGNYSAIDSLREGRKVLIEEAGSTMVTVAKDVKFQIEFDPKQVQRYRLLGYKNRRLAAQDFDNDAKDAGDLGAGHSVTALYEVIPTGQDVGVTQNVWSILSGQPTGTPLATVKLRYKAPDDDQSELLEFPIPAQSSPLAKASEDHRWAVAVAGTGLALDGDRAAQEIDLAQLSSLAEGALGSPHDEYRVEFLDLLGTAQTLVRRRD